ncbi:MAG: S49 family peptidase [Pseudomonadota bacterium]|jgi:signal peptide peptidase SppA
MNGGLQILDGIAVIPVLGTLVRRSSYLGAASGLTSYHDIEAMAEQAFADPDVRAVLLEIDSSGGEAGGVFDLAERLRQLAQSSGKPLWAIADEAALSAAYAIAAAAERIWVTTTAEAGSIGVVAVHLDQSARDAMEGLSYTFIHAGARKVDGNPHRPLSEEARAAITQDMESLYTRFVDWVASRRGLSAARVRAQEAGIYRGETAVQAGLADAVGTLRDALAAFESRLSQIAALPGRNLSKGGLAMSYEPVAAEARAETPHEPPIQDSVIERAALDRAAEIVEIAEQARALGVVIDASAAIREGLAPDALRARVLKEAADRDRSMNIVAHAPHADTPTVSPLIAAARQFAKKGAY